MSAAACSAARSYAHSTSSAFFFLDLASACRVLPQSVLLQLLLPRRNGSLCCPAHVAVAPSVLQQLLLPSHSCSCSATAASALPQLLLFNSSCFSHLPQLCCSLSVMIQPAFQHTAHQTAMEPSILSVHSRSYSQPLLQQPCLFLLL